MEGGKKSEASKPNGVPKMWKDADLPNLARPQQRRKGGERYSVGQREGESQRRGHSVELLRTRRRKSSTALYTGTRPQK